MAKKYKARLILPDGDVIDIMVSRRKIVALIGRDRKITIVQRVLKYLKINLNPRR